VAHKSNEFKIFPKMNTSVAEVEEIKIKSDFKLQDYKSTTLVFDNFTSLKTDEIQEMDEE